MRNANNTAETGAKRGETNRGSRGSWSKAARLFWFLLFALALFLTLISGRRPLAVQIGQTAERDYRARMAFTSPDLERTETARNLARLKQPPVFQLRPAAWRESVEELVKWIEEGNRAAFRQHLPSGFDMEGFLKLLPELQERTDALKEALLSLPEDRLVDAEDLRTTLVQDKRSEAVTITAPGREPKRVPMAKLVPLEGSTPAVRAALSGALGGLRNSSALLAGEGLARLLQPGLTLDVEASRRAAQRAAEEEPVRRKKVEPGRVLLAEGAEVTRQNVEDLRRERTHYLASRAGRIVTAQHYAGVALMVVLLLLAGLLYARRYEPELIRRRLQLLSFILLTLLLVAMARLCVVHGLTALLVPVPMMVIIMCLVYGQRSGLAAGVFYALLVRLATPGANTEFIVLLLGGLMAALLTREVQTRGAVIKAGLLTGVVQLLGVWGVGLMLAPEGARVELAFWQSPLLMDSVAGLANGFLSGFIVSGALPLIERLFGITTDVRLLEWSDPNQPLLQRLLLDAPGSYHHSMLVGSLAADAAEAVGANPLLARVSAYFHDVGKLKKPEYFAENLPEGAKNPHEDLTPTMSSLIITAHPKDGAEMAGEYGVPKEVCDIILESHGSSVLKYFWNKAKGAEAGYEQMQEHDFRYRLPKPKSKEAAIVMLADAVESAARSLETPDPQRLHSVAREIILDRLHDGQLDESGLTITDLKRLEDSLVHGITAMFHSRVRYPGQEEQAEEEWGGEVAREDHHEGRSVQQTGSR